MALILEPTRVLLQSDDGNWYWTSMALVDGIATIETDGSTPIAPPVGATPYALLRLSASYYRWTLESLGGTAQGSHFELSVADGTERNSIPLILGSTTYTLALDLVDGEPTMTITTVAPPPPPPSTSSNIAQLSIIPYTVPFGTCYPASVQELINLVAKSTVQFASSRFTIVITSETTPGATDRDKLWKKSDSGLIFHYDTSLTNWVAPHLMAPGSQRHELWTGDLTALATEDGGDTNAPGLVSGPMWEVDPAFAGRFPLGVGTLPVSTTVVAALGTGGADQVTLTQAQLPMIKLSVNTAIIGRSDVVAGGAEPVVGQTYGSTPLPTVGGAVDGTSQTSAARYYTKGQTDDLGSGSPFSMMPPWIGTFFIRRTSRKFYKG